MQYFPGWINGGKKTTIPKIYLCFFKEILLTNIVYTAPVIPDFICTSQLTEGMNV